jgi:hypothetical protein
LRNQFPEIRNVRGFCPRQSIAALHYSTARREIELIMIHTALVRFKDETHSIDVAGSAANGGLDAEVRRALSGGKEFAPSALRFYVDGAAAVLLDEIKQSSDGAIVIRASLACDTLCGGKVFF